MFDKTKLFEQNNTGKIFFTGILYKYKSMSIFFI